MNRRIRLLALSLFGGAVLYLGLLSGGTAFASGSGGVGSGGAGGGGNSGGPWGYSYNGWGWRLYDPYGSGPSASPKINSGSWSAAQSACQGYSQHVAVFTLNTTQYYSQSNPGIQMGYAYQSVYYSPSLFQQYITDGKDYQPVYKYIYKDTNYISVPEAQAAYDALPGNLKTGYIFGQNVAWFCYGILPPPANWSLSGYTAAGGSSVYPGQSVSFTSKIWNDNEGGTASFQYGPRYFYSSTSTPSLNSSGIYNGELMTVANASTTLGPGQSKTGIGQTVTVPANTSAKYICGTVAFSPANSSGKANGRSPAKCYTINHPTLSCGTVTPNAVEPGQPFTVTASLGTGSTANRTAIDTYGSPSFYVTIYNSSAAVVAGAGSLSVTRPAGSPTYVLTIPESGVPTAGQYEISWGINSTMSGITMRCPGGFNPANPPGTSGNPPANLIAAYKPYFTVTGGDISSDGGITSWNEDGASYAGGASQLAALATGNITSFVTGRGLAAFGSGYGLAFANTTHSGSIYGGGYTPTVSIPVVSTAGAPVVNTTLSQLKGVYTYSGNLTLDGVVPGPRNVTIVMTSGDLYIDGNITYSYGSIAQIPRLTVIVQNGNIYVNNNVHEIHGVFYAAGGLGQGNFYSCATASGAPSTDYNTCNNQLTVYGSVTANKLILSRTHGSVHASSGTPAEPAENFFYSPEVWLAPPDSTGGNPNLIYNSYVSLPPIL